MNHKTLDMEFKIDDLTDEGEFVGYASVSGNLDLGNDIIEAGAFKRTLTAWRKSKRPIPILLEHDPNQPIGKTLEAVEDERGLKVRGQLLLDLPKAREAHTLLKERVLTGLSIGYRSVKDKLETAGDRTVRRIKEIKLYEWSPVLWPMNPEAAIESVKAEDDRITDIESRLAALESRPATEPTSDPSGQHSEGTPPATDCDPHTHSQVPSEAMEWLRNLQQLTQ